MFWEELSKLATDTSWVVILLLVVGFVLCFIEAIIPNYGIVGITGLLCEIAAIILHAVLSGSILQVFVIVIIVLVGLSLLLVLFTKSAKNGLLGKTALIENKTAIPIDYADQENNINANLIGQIGIAIVDCRPIGKLKINDKTFDVLCRGDYLLIGQMAKVIDVVGNNIYVEKIEKGE